MDSQYVSRTLGSCLSEGLAELIELRPLDPIEFLELWIRKYNYNQKLELQKAAHQRELEEEQRRVREDTLHQETLQEEENQIRATQHVPESADESPPDLQQREDDELRETAADLADHTESEAVTEPNDQEENPAGAAGEEQTSEILDTEASLSQQDLRDTQNESAEADAPPEERAEEERAEEERAEEERAEEERAEEERAEEDSEERARGKEEGEEDGGA